MTIDEAIAHAREVASQGCAECNRDHEQLAEWLEELKIYKKALEHACVRLEGYDLIFDREYGCYASKWNRKRWELWAIDKAEEDLKNE